MISISLARLRDDVNQRRLARLHALDSAFNRACQVLRIRNWPLAEEAVCLRELGVIDVRIRDRRPNVGAIDTPIISRALRLNSSPRWRRASIVPSLCGVPPRALRHALRKLFCDRPWSGV